MVGDGLNSPRQHGDYLDGENQDNIFPDKYSMRNTRVLKVKSSQITAVPDYIFETASTELVNVVNLEGNLLTEVPRDLPLISELLTELVLAKNQLTYVPSFMSQFSKLLICNLSNNLLRALPMEFAGLQNLRELNISYNRLDHLPHCIYELDSLEVLTANDNQIREVNASDNGLGALRQLHSLDLSNNDIHMVPPVLGNQTNIQSLKLTGNPFRQPRHQILAMGTAATLEYLRGRIPL